MVMRICEVLSYDVRCEQILTLFPAILNRFFIDQVTKEYGGAQGEQDALGSFLSA